jgi:hypothetical protein
VSKWDYDRVASLLQQVSDQAASIAADIEAATPGEFDLVAILYRVDQVHRDLSAAKTLLTRERAKRV